MQHEEISELILRLEEAATGTLEEVDDDPGLRALVDGTGLDLKNPEAVREAILVLGRRAQTVGGGRALAVRRSNLPHLTERDLPGLTRALLGVMETTRLECSDPEKLEAQLHLAADEALEVYQRNLPSRSDADTRWWEEVRTAVHKRLVPGFENIARQVARLEGNAFLGTLLRSRALMAILVAAPGLITFDMPVSTPLVTLALALLGAFVVHPVWLWFVTGPAREVETSFCNEATRIARLSGEEPWPEEAFTLRGVVSDLLPILDGERRATPVAESNLREAIRDYFTRVAPRFPGGSSRSPRYFKHLQEFSEGHITRRYAEFARARRKLEARALGRVFDLPPLSALLVALVTLPISWGVCRISPFPRSIELPLMILIFVALGWILPRLVPGATPARKALEDELASHQEELDQLP